MSVTLVGSRVVPNHIESIAFRIGQKLAESGERMRSGGAHGMDHTWELAYRSVGKKRLMNIILPTELFNGKFSNKDYYTFIGDYDDTLLKKADSIIQEVHEYYDDLNGFSYWAHIRNVFQVLGEDLESPSTETFLYAPINGCSVKGGTRSAFEISKLYGIPTHNLAHRNTLLELQERFGVTPNNLHFLF